MHRFRLSSIACLFVLIALASAALAGSAGNTSNTAPFLITLKFAGGSAADYVAAVCKAAGGLNVYVAPEAKAVPMPPIELNGVTPDSALQLLHQRTVVNDDGEIILQWAERGTIADGEQPIFSITAVVKRAYRSASLQSDVWSLTEILLSGTKADDILTAIQTALDLMGKDTPPPQIRFHEATGILIARGTRDQLSTIQQVLQSLTRSAAEKRALTGDGPQRAIHERDLQIAALQQRIRELESQLAREKKN